MIRLGETLFSRNLNIYRGFCLFAAVFILVFGFVHKAVQSSAIDSLAVRLMICAFCLGLYALSFWSARIRDSLDGYVLSLYHLLSLWLLFLIFLNQASPDYVISLMILLFAGSFGIHKHAYLFWHSVPTILMAILICFMIQEPRMDRGFVILSLVTTDLLAYGFMRSKIKILADLAVREDLLKSVFNESADSILLVDPASEKISDCNESAVTMFGMGSKGDMIGMDFAALCPSPAPGGEPVPLLRQIRQNQYVHKEMECLKRNGERLWGDFAARRITVAEASFCLVRISDVTQRKAAQKERQILYKAFETTSIGITITDLEGIILFSNPADASLHGYDDQELIGKNARVFSPSQNWKPMSPERIREIRKWKREGLNIRKDQSTFPVHLISDVIKNPEGDPIGMVTTCEDISERKLTEKALRESEERYALAVRGVNDGLWDWNLLSGEVYFSPHWKAMLGYDEEEIGNTPEEWFSRVHPDDIERLKTAVKRHINGHAPNLESEHRMLHKNKTYLWVINRGISVRDGSGKAYRIVGAQSSILHNALHDALTGLPNRILFMDRLTRAVERSKRKKDYLFAVLFLDLDLFKSVNDTLGHLIGDELLVEIARRLESCMRTGDTVARLGGDEFTILLDEIRSEHNAVEIVERILSQVAMPAQIQGNEIFITASTGIALNEFGYSHPEDILRAADTAMYRAKMLGKACYQVFNKEMHDQAVSRLFFERQLHKALEQQEFHVYYQPMVSLKTGCITGLEALLRWRHAQQDLLMPSQFIGVAEETGAIVAVGEWVLRTACARVKALQEGGFASMRMAVNLSLTQLKLPNIGDLLSEILMEAGLEPRFLELELAESLITNHAESLMETLQRLHGLGIQISIDDFGKGNSSLTNLKHLPVDAIKIDESFVRDIETDPNDAAIVSTMISLAHKLNMRVIAEAVETQKQLDFLRAHRCDEIQGFLFCKPLPVHEMDGICERKLRN